MVASLVCVLAVSALAYTGTLRIPPESVTQTVTLTDGSKLVGKTTMITADKIEFQTQFGLMTIALDKIADVSENKAVEEVKPAEETRKVEHAQSVEPVKAVEKPKEETAAVEQSMHPGWFPNPNRTRLLIGPNARPLRANEGYFYDLWVFFPGIAYGITKNISISAGASIIPGIDNQLFYVIPKVGFEASKQLDLAASVVIFRLWNETLYFGLGNATFGTDDVSLTAGLGLAWSEHGMMETPALQVGGEYRVGKRVALVGETWSIPGEEDAGIVVLGGVRLLGQGMTVDLGFATATKSDSDSKSNLDEEYYDEGNSEDPDWIPYIDFVWNF
jgi:hypothetical protein